MGLDIAPNYAGIITGISNTFATIPGFVAPEIMGALTASASADPPVMLLTTAWRIVFLLAALVITLGGIVFLFGSTAEIQPWAQPGQSDLNGNEEKRDRETKEHESPL